MKTKKTLIFLSLIALCCAAVFFSCDVPLALGHRLDIEGPLVEFTSPPAREAVSEQFEIKGTVSDYSPIETLLIKASLNNEEFAKQWRYTKSGKWEVSENHGTSWAAYSAAEWNGDEKSASWSVTVDMSVGGQEPQDGEYTFSAQAWDTGGFTDDNSFKTLVLIYDADPPKVDVFNPYLYSRYASYDPGTETFGVSAGDSNGQELQSLRDEYDHRIPSLLGKFLTQEFQLQWQIEDNHDIDSIEILFYEHNVDIDGIEETGIPQNYIYSYKGSNSPNGSVWVPNLKGNAGTYNEAMYDGGIIKKSAASKTTIKVVAMCYDMAGHVNQEKVLGYFIFWPEAAEPWIIYTDGMKEPGYYAGKDSSYTEAEFKEDVFMIYPGRSIKATAFQAQGASRVEYSLYEYDLETRSILPDAVNLSYLKLDNNFTDELNADEKLVTARNSLRPNGTYSTIFPWSFTPPPRSKNYAIRATPYDFNGIAGQVYESVFMVQDITFPDFPEPPQPAASIPLFKAISQNKITISGIVSDATEVVSLYIVWINPQSKSYAAMSQLSYFRDSSYVGWKQAVDANLQDGNFILENKYDDGFPNKVWKVPVTPAGEDYETFRKLYSYEQEIDITQHLNIAGSTTSNNQPLISQVFLLRAENPDGRCTIITYAPQGDTLHPKIGITRVTVTSVGTGGTPTTTVCNPGVYTQVPIFQNGDRIFVEGTWEEDSTEILPINTYLTPNVKFEINRTQVTGILNPATGNAVSGTFTINALVGTHIDLSNMKDTLSVSATIQDIGGNPAEVANSWLIESDTLKFLRISSEKNDGTYRVGEPIDIFLEFNKPVMLKEDRANPVLILNTGGRAYYKEGQDTESPRQYFTYTVAAGENTPADSNGNPTQFLNVRGISINNGVTEITSDTTNLWQAANYPFAWENTLMDGKKDEIRLTRASAHSNPVQVSVTGQTNTVWARALPVTSSSGDSDYMFTLGGGKRIQIDNEAPKITGFTASPQGWYRVGTDIYITATFNKNVKIGTGTNVPRLQLSTNNWTSTSNAADVRVNNNQITFRYAVQAGDNAAPPSVLGFDGAIFDIPGTSIASDAVTSMTTGKTLTGVNLDNTAPAVPTVTVWQGTAPTNNAAPGGTALGTSSTAAVALGNLYNDNLFVRIAGSAGNNNLGRLEYSLDGGTNWTSLTSTGLSGIGAVNIPITSNGDYTVRARQIDQAGNIATVNAGASYDVTFRRDPGNLITRISSTSPNGTYTHKSGFGNGSQINITIYFRRSVSISAVSGITLSAVNGPNNGTPIILNNTNRPGSVTLPQNNVTALTFTYTVKDEDPVGSNNGDRMPTGVNWLDVTGIGTITATDGNLDGGTNKDVTSFFALPAAGPTTTKLRLGENKEIRVESGALTRSSIAFKTTSAAGVPTLDSYDTTNGWVTGAANEGNAKFQGIRSDDGSFWTTLEIQFNHAINKGSGEITIEQIAGSVNTAYHLPIVLTESQYNRFRGVASADNSAENFNKYYTKGTNGYINGQGSDTSTKYVLNYNNNPNSDRPTAVFTGDVIPDSGFITAFRKAERITINVNSQAVEINGNTLKIRLTGSNAPQVPGATYTIRYPAGLVTDNLGNGSPDSNNGANTSMAETGANIVVGINRDLGGVAKPFVRIKKTQDIIDNRRTASATTPTLTAQQPQYAYVRIDSRTPGSSIVYGYQLTTYSAANGMTGNWSVTTGPVTQTAATRPTTVTTPYVAQPNAGTDTYGIRIGNTTHQGIKWWVVARATATVGGTAYTSSDSDEMAYRTAITYRLRQMERLDTTGQILIGENGGNAQNPTYNVNGGQIWIRGGDSIGSSSIPGFPLTWEDNFNDLRNNQKRAGIRLMTKNPPTTGNLTDSTWEFLSWEINATAYIDIILGLDNTQTIYDYNFYPSYNINEVWQYGPRYWTLQRAGWSSSKALYPIYPGEIRYLDTGNAYWDGKGPMNFSSAFKSRPSQSANGGVAGWTTTIPNPNTNN